MKIFRVVGLCQWGDCECRLHDGEEINENNIPPLHEGCHCYIEDVVGIKRCKKEGGINENSKREIFE